MRKLSTNEFISKCINIHGHKYDYSIVNYKGSHIKVKIICNKHGIFEQLPYNHILGKGCSMCNPKISEKISLDEFIKRCNYTHSSIYNYKLVDYKNSKTKIKIICNKHGIFEQEPRLHIKGSKCPTCQGNKKVTKNEFIKRSNLLFNNKYDYTLVDINGVKNKTIIICPKHGKFNQVIDSHLQGHGCSKCNDSKGEKIISWFLDKNNIKHESQKTFLGCFDIRKLKFDFYIESINTCIEFDGKHHFEKIEFGEKKLKDTIKKDRIKNKFCKENNINLLRISYKDNIIEKLSFLINEE